MTGEIPGLRPASPCALVIFGASGDLTKRLLIPAVYNLKLSVLLPENFAIAGVARTEQTDDAFRGGLQKALQQFSSEPVDASTWDRLAEYLEKQSSGKDRHD